MVGRGGGGGGGGGGAVRLPGYSEPIFIVTYRCMKSDSRLFKLN